MTNYNDEEKGKRLRGSMAPKTDADVALSGTNSGETNNKQEALSGTNSGEEKEVAQAGSYSVDDVEFEEEKHEENKEKKNRLTEIVDEVIEDIEEKMKKNK
ncbi:MAG: rRNA processing protein [Enterococcus sp.]